MKPHNSSGRPDQTARDTRRITHEEIFRQLILDEIRSGTLTAWRRRRIVRYAAAMGLTATRAGKLVEQCRQEMSAHPDPRMRAHAAKVDDWSAPGWIWIPSAVVVVVWLLHRLSGQWLS